jgi:hypothetical protein
MTNKAMLGQHPYLQRYGRDISQDNTLAVNKYIMECWETFIGVEHLGTAGAKELAADKLFTRMKRLQLQLQEAKSLVRIAESMDVLW